MHPLLMIGGDAPATLNGGPWSNLLVEFPATTHNNEDLQVTWLGGAPQRPVTNNWTGTGTLYYRIDAASWVAYSGSFMIDRNSTLAWRLVTTTNETLADSQVRVGGAIIDTFSIQATGFP